MKQGKRKAGKLFMRRKKHQKKKKPKVITSSSKNDEWSYHDFSSDEDVNGSAKDELSDASSDGSSSSAEEDVDVNKKAPASSDEGSGSSVENAPASSDEGSRSSTEKAPASSDEGSRSSALKRPASSDEGSASSDDDEVKKTSDKEEPASRSWAGRAVAVSEKEAPEEREEAWKENETEFLIAILYAELVIHEKDVNQLDWAGVVQKLYHQTRKQTSVTQVQTFYKKFRDETTQFMHLLQVTGYEWNPNNNKVTCKDHVWEHIYWIHGGEKMFRNKGLLHYNVLRDIFGSGSKHFAQESHVHT